MIHWPPTWHSHQELLGAKSTWGIHWPEPATPLRGTQGPRSLRKASLGVSTEMVLLKRDCCSLGFTGQHHQHRQKAGEKGRISALVQTH